MKLLSSLRIPQTVSELSYYQCRIECSWHPVLEEAYEIAVLCFEVHLWPKLTHGILPYYILRGLRWYREDMLPFHCQIRNTEYLTTRKIVRSLRSVGGYMGWFNHIISKTGRRNVNTNRRSPHRHTDIFYMSILKFNVFYSV